MRGFLISRSVCVASFDDDRWGIDLDRGLTPVLTVAAFGRVDLLQDEL